MKLKKIIETAASAATALTIFTASLSSFPMNASAANNQLNVKIYMDESMCSNLSSICDDVTLGTYGVPSSFNTRLPAITGYAYAYYMNSGAYINFSNFFTGTDLLESPAYLCVSESDGSINALMKDCTCKSVMQCQVGNWHCNNVNVFSDSIPEYDKNNTAVLYFTVSKMCANTSTKHGNPYGATNKSEMWSLVRDVDYFHDHYNETSYPYAYARMVTVHEIGHFYNVADHYDEYASSNSVANCIWGDNRENFYIAKSCTTCSTCHNTIIANRDIYQHT